MIICEISTLSFFLYLIIQVSATEDGGVERGAYPYMAYVYYSDDKIREKNDTVRFFRSAILVKPQYLVSAAIDPTNETEGFPRKTLLARLGAVSIDGTVSLNEDEGEQEREVIQIMRPMNHTKEKWLTSDISILKVLLPFNMTRGVNMTSLSTSNQPLAGKSCTVLTFSKKEPTSEETLLRMWTVDNLAKNNCGDLLESDRMICSTAFEKNPENELFCYGNAGGPLICEDEVVALQSYIGDHCKPPYIYQRLHFWQDFLKCGIHGECHSERCQDICVATDKDEPERPPPLEPPSSIPPLEPPSHIPPLEEPTTITEEAKAAPEETRQEPSVDALQDVIVTTARPDNSTVEVVVRDVGQKIVRRHYKSGAGEAAKISIRLFFWNLIFILLS